MPSYGARRWLLLVGGLAMTLASGRAVGAQRPDEWPVHSMQRPRPPVVDPGPGALPVPPSRDAVVLFDGSSLDRWRHADGRAATWIVRDGYVEVRPGSGDLLTRDDFGDVQLHIEWMSPDPPEHDGQNRGNSGVYLMNTYEVQVLDSYQNPTYADGQAAAIYGQFPPLVNASRPPGSWQSFDMIFRGPQFDSAGAVVRPATITVLHNGVVVHDHVTLTGPTAHQDRPPYRRHPDRLPLKLQDHGQPVRFRNIWLRELPPLP